MRKPKTQQKKSIDEISGRDLFQTPNYAVDLLVPFIPKDVGVIWECACGQGKILQALLNHGYGCAGTDLQQGINFLDDDYPENYDAITTNPPFSLKKEFYLQCLKYELPFALLIPADYSGWIIKAIKDDGAEKIIPTRRIDYITPNTLYRIHEGEVWEKVRENHPAYKKLEEFKDDRAITWQGILEKYEDYCNYDSIYDAPAKLLRKYSSSYYHSMWLTWGFNLGRSETFVELTNEMKNNI